MRWWWAPVVVAAWLLAAAADPRAAVGQGGERDVVLRIRPHVGDTIRGRLEQQVDMTAWSRTPGGDSTMEMKSSMSMLALLRNIVEGSEGDATTLLIAIDSIALSASGTPLPVGDVRRQLQGKRMRMRVTSQGAMVMLDAPDEMSADLQAALSHVPATLPPRAVAVGEGWSQTMAVPIAGDPSGRGATVRATFRLDSLSRGGDLAFVSMRGAVLRDSAGATAQGTKRLVTGTLTGGMTVDRKRGWIVDSRVSISVRSLKPRRTAASTAEPLHLQIRVTQRIRALEGR